MNPSTVWITIILAVGAVLLSLSLVWCGFLLVEPGSDKLVDISISVSNGLQMNKSLPGLVFILGGVAVMYFAFVKLVKQNDK